MNIAERIIVALDVDSRERALQVVPQLTPVIRYFKIGSQLFTAHGPELVREVTKTGARVFLDLKFHDIPQTVANAVVEAGRLGVSLINVHALGGMAMMQAAVRALANCFPSEKRPRLIAVTILTSIGEVDSREIGFPLPISDQTVRLALMAQRAGLDGVVASPLEISEIRNSCGKDFLIVTPGIRPPQSDVDDQVRIATPRRALDDGADFLVIGRPILDAADPLRAAQEIIESVDRR